MGVRERKKGQKCVEREKVAERWKCEREERESVRRERISTEREREREREDKHTHTHRERERESEKDTEE